MTKKKVTIPIVCPFCGAEKTVSTDGKHFACKDCGRAWPIHGKGGS